MKGWIALDIDGTLTEEETTIPSEVVEALFLYVKEGWQLAIVTGRSPHFSRVILSELKFPFILIPHNGSSVFEMPEDRRIFTRFIPKEVLPILVQACGGLGTGILIYLGMVEGDQAVFRPQDFNKQHLNMLKTWEKRQQEMWSPIDSFDELQDFPLAKCVGFPREIEEIQKRLEKAPCRCTQLKDPFETGKSILLVTAEGVSKGSTLEWLMERRGRGARVIAAGDDRNDFALLSVADVKISMPHAPKELLEMADIIAPPTKEMGILKALAQATA